MEWDRCLVSKHQSPVIKGKKNQVGEAKAVMGARHPARVARRCLVGGSLQRRATHVRADLASI